jgi:ankyrin repeat protein
MSSSSAEVETLPELKSAAEVLQLLLIAGSQAHRSLVALLDASTALSATGASATVSSTSLPSAPSSPTSSGFVMSRAERLIAAETAAQLEAEAAECAANDPPLQRSLTTGAAGAAGGSAAAPSVMVAGDGKAGAELGAALPQLELAACASVAMPDVSIVHQGVMENNANVIAVAHAAQLHAGSAAASGSGTAAQSLAQQAQQQQYHPQSAAGQLAAQANAASGISNAMLATHQQQQLLLQHQQQLQRQQAILQQQLLMAGAVHANASAAISLPSNDCTALMASSRAGHFEVTKLLLKAGAKIDQVGRHGETALMLAAAAGHEAIVRLLLASGAAVNALARDGGTPLMHAANNGHAACVRALLENGALVDVACNSGDSALILAAARGQTAAVLLLLESNASVQLTRPTDGNTALSLAAAGGHQAVAALLVDCGAASSDAIDSLSSDKMRQMGLKMALPRCVKCMKAMKRGEPKLCAGCKQASYCSAECQKGDWKRHRVSCKLWAAHRAEEAALPVASAEPAAPAPAPATSQPAASSTAVEAGPPATALD